MTTEKNKQLTFLKIPLLLLGMVLLFSFGVNAASAANTTQNASQIYVSTQGNDTWDGLSATYNSTSESGPKATINNATGTVATNGTVYIASGTYNEHGINIETNMTIKGENQQNTIINGTQSGTIFNIASGVNVTISNLTLTNGNNYDGGAIYNNGILTVNNCKFTGNTATNGGAIYNNAPLTIANTTTPTGNTITNNDGTLTINNCTFTGNTATNDGGAIYNNAPLTIITSTLTTNTLTNNGATLNITGSTLTGNTATNDGGAIYNNAPLTIITSTLTGNTLTNNGGTLNITNSTLTNNTATNDGGAIYNNATITITNNTLTGNTITNNSGTLNVTSSTLNNNTATDDGGAIYNNAALTENNNTLTGNTITNNSGTLNVTNSTLTGNIATYDGGAIYNEGNAIIQFNRIVGNTATLGNALYIYSGTVNATLNWWGTNDNPSLTGDIYNYNGVCNYDPWIIQSIPTITNIDPANGATNVPVNKVITITFSTPIQIGRSNYWNSIYVQNSDGVYIPLYRSINGYVLTLTPTTNWTLGTTYTIKIPQYSVADLTGTLLTNTTISIFTTHPAPVISTIDPTNGAVNVLVNKVITVTFNEPIQPGSSGSYNSIYVQNTLTGVYIPLIKTINGNTLTLTPTTNWTLGTTYTISIPKYSIADLTGTPLANTTTSTFTTDYAPVISTIDPANGATSVPVNKVITITFSEPIQIGSSNYWNSIYVQNTATGAYIPVTKNINGNTLTLTPTTNWTPGTTYTINIPANVITNLTGTPLANTSNTTFNT